MPRFKAVIQGCDNSGFTGVTLSAIALDVFGIFPSFDVESETQTSMNGTQIGRRKYRTVLELECIPFSTWDYQRITTTEATLFLIQDVLSKSFCRIKAANPPTEALPDRYTDSTNFPKTAALLPFQFVKCDISTSKEWASGNEKLILTCYAKTL